VGEFGLIRKLSKQLRYSKNVIKGVGDDAAVIGYRQGLHLLFTTDMLIEGVHFKLSKTRPSLVGRKALAVNISDIAAMGGIPKYAVVAFGFRSSSKVSFVKEILGGMKGIADKFGVDIVGGDTNRSDKLIISISLLGETEKKNLILRSGAKPNDVVFVTGRLGGSYRSGRHLKFVPRVKEARYLVKNFGISSMIDISDGLAGDLKRIAESSHVGVAIDDGAIPCNRGCKTTDALFDGEDFELLFTAPRKEASLIEKKWPYDLKLTRIGEVTKSKGVIELLTKKGAKKKITKKGFNHF